MRRLLPAILAASCASEALVPRTDGVVAEVHLHQYELGWHAVAGFVETPVPVREELDEMLVHFPTEPASIEGNCRLELPTNCTPTCPGDTEYCSAARCVPYKKLRFEDAGPVHVRGSSTGDAFALFFDARTGHYKTDRPVGAPLYAAGDRLRIESARFAADVVAPAMPVVRTPLVIPDGPYEVAWEPAGGQMVVRLYAVAPSGDAAYITCLDDDHGAMTIPASMIARMPRPPRTVSLNVERRARQKLRLGPGQLAVVTVASTLLRDRKD